MGHKEEQNLKKNYKIVSFITLVVLSIYLIGYLVAFARKPQIPIETVNYGTIDIPTTLRGIIIRNEEVVYSPMSGQPQYNYTENDRVAKNASVCTVKNTATTDIIESEIVKINKDIMEAQKNREEYSLFKDDITRIENNISSLIEGNMFKFSTYTIEDVYSLKNQVETQVNLRNQIWYVENTRSTSELIAEKDQYENQLNESQSVIRANSSGIFCLKVDNFEEIVTPDVKDSIAKEQIKMTVQPKYISKQMSVAEGEPLFKIVKDNTWYIASYIPTEIASQWTVGEFVDIYTTVNDEEKSVSAKIEIINIVDKEAYVVFVTDKNIIDFMDIRTLDFKVKENIYEGFKIPNDAIVEKTFLKIPKYCIIESLGNEGVIEREGEKDTFVDINISKSDEENVYVLQEFGALKLGDTLVPAGAGVEPYVIGEVAVYKGVYVANSSLATFVVIDIVGQNSDYAIVSAENRYGLKVYDKIVSDAKAVVDAEALN
ncbi:MAG: HlyD family efflux transporter periplasmic adaptor subunit [Anaerotignaceae bacterium]